MGGLGRGLRTDNEPLLLREHNHEQYVLLPCVRHSLLDWSYLLQHYGREYYFRFAGALHKRLQHNQHLRSLFKQIQHHHKERHYLQFCLRHLFPQACLKRAYPEQHNIQHISFWSNGHSKRKRNILRRGSLHVPSHHKQHYLYKQFNRNPSRHI